MGAEAPAAVVVNAVCERDPINFSEAMRSDKRDGWTKAMEEEIKALQDNNVWKVVKRTPVQARCTPSGAIRPRRTLKASLRD